MPSIRIDTAKILGALLGSGAAVLGRQVTHDSYAYVRSLFETEKTHQVELSVPDQYFQAFFSASNFARFTNDKVILYSYARLAQLPAAEQHAILADASQQAGSDPTRITHAVVQYIWERDRGSLAGR
jgi:hypothetical protein